ncbi:hypothetical protein H4R18_002036, partial [Coemansia javaensis]
MQTAYIVGIKRQFGNQLRRLINHLAGVKDKAKQIRSEMGKRPNREVRRELEERLWRPVRLLKEQVARRRPDPAQVHEDWRWILGVLAPIHKAYDDDYKFNNDPSKATIYYSAIWGRLFNTNNRIFKKRRGFEFNGTISTNAVGKGHDDEDQYIHNLDPAEIKRLLPRMVFADPGRRDIIFCMGYQSTKEEPKLLR